MTIKKPDLKFQIRFFYYFILLNINDLMLHTFNIIFKQIQYFLQDFIYISLRIHILTILITQLYFKYFLVDIPDIITVDTL